MNATFAGEAYRVTDQESATERVILDEALFYKVVTITFSWNRRW